jgi:phosphatidylserine/phosphatidylglycerophosphate/cardiolipin synthase-like enzyme
MATPRVEFDLDIGFRLLGIEIHSGSEANARAIATLWGRAGESIFILADRLTPYFYQDEAIQISIAEALKRGVKVDIACGPEPTKESIDALKSKAQQFKEAGGKITLHILKQRPTMHFEVVDRKHVRIEKPHPIDEIERHSMIGLNESGLARKLENLFVERISKAVSHEVLG